jgi:hypothetical protein
MFSAALAAHAQARADALADDHTRVRAELPGVSRVSVEPVLPVEVIGIYVVVPAGIRVVARALRRSHAAALAFDALTVEGGLIAPAMLARIGEQKAGDQAESDCHIPKGLTLRDEIARYFRIGQALCAELCASPAPSAAATTRFVEALPRDVFGFGDISRVGTRTLGDHLYVVTLEARTGRVPVVVVLPSDDLDAPSVYLPSEGRRRSAASAVQDWLNASEGALWGLCSNGFQLRLVRDNASLTRPAFI